MNEQHGLWRASFTAFLNNAPFIAVYIGLIVIFSFVSGFSNANTAAFVVSALLASVLGVLLAMTAHVSVLKVVKGTEAIKDEAIKASLIVFTLYAVGFFVLTLLLTMCFLLVAAAVSFILLKLGMPMAGLWMFAITRVLTYIFLYIGAAFILARWGTVLPAIILGQARSLRAARERSKTSFNDAFSGLLISFGLLNFLFFMPNLYIFLAFLPGVGKYIPLLPKSLFEMLPVIDIVLKLVIGSFQIVMTSVILSRAYLTSRNQNVITNQV
jgi:hypothetical protein